MDITLDKYYNNKTWKYLFPCLRGHGEEFVINFNKLKPLALGIHDSIVDNLQFSYQKNIYILCDKRDEKLFNLTLNWLKEQEYFVIDYCFDSNILDSETHMIVVRVPKMFETTYDYFLKGQYSKMYKEEHLKILFPAEKKEKELSVLICNPAIIKDFIKILNQKFDTDIKEEDNIDFNELELPLVNKEEVFNFQCKERLFFVEELDKNKIKV